MCNYQPNIDIVSDDEHFARWLYRPPKEEKIVGFAKANIGEIRGIADEQETSIDVVLTKSDVPFHAEIRFTIDGQLIRGNNQNPHFLRYKDKLKNLFAKDIFKM